MPAEQMSQYYREAVDTYEKYRPHGDEDVVKIANLCLLAGIDEKDIDLIYQAACIEERDHRISSAIGLYDRLLDFIENSSTRSGGRAGNVRAMFIRTVERRASLSPFYPNLKKLYPSLCRALDIAHNLGDKNSQASIHLLMGQNTGCPFNTARRRSTSTRRGADPENEEQQPVPEGLQSQGLSFWIRGNFSKAIRYYERSIGMIDSPAADDFSNARLSSTGTVLHPGGHAAERTGTVRERLPPCGKDEQRSAGRIRSFHKRA